MVETQPPARRGGLPAARWARPARGRAGARRRIHDAVMLSRVRPSPAVCRRAHLLVGCILKSSPCPAAPQTGAGDPIPSRLRTGGGPAGCPHPGPRPGGACSLRLASESPALSPSLPFPQALPLLPSESRPGVADPAPGPGQHRRARAAFTNGSASVSPAEFQLPLRVSSSASET